MKKTLSILFVIIILAVGALVCTIRWNAWFGMPAEPEYTGETIQAHFHGFGDSIVPGFIYQDGLYYETCLSNNNDTCLSNCSGVRLSNFNNTCLSDTLSILLLGDIHNQITHDEWQTLSSRHPHIDAYAQLGDFMDRPYFYHEQMLLHSLQDTRFDSIALLSVPGNHEYIKGIFPSLPDRWTELFHNPKNGPAGYKGRTYYTDFPTCRFIGIDTNGLNHLVNYTRLHAWLHHAITKSTRPVIVMMHHPVHSCAKGRQNLFIRLLLGDVLDKADVVIAGHDHGYCRRLPYLNTNSAMKQYEMVLVENAEVQEQGKRLYELIDSWNERIDSIGSAGCQSQTTIRIQTREIGSGELIDEFLIHR